MAIRKELIGNQLYLYLNGKLIYKRWLDTGESLVFDVMAYDKYTLISLKDLELENNDRWIAVKANLKLKPTAEGGRKTGIKSGYRPNHVFEYREGKVLQTYIGAIIFNVPTVEPGEQCMVTVRFLASTPVERYLTLNSKWWIHEGEKCLGTLEMIGFVD